MEREDFKFLSGKRSIAVIGGGSAGYFTALYLEKKIPNWDITIIESSKIPIIGVGEATTPLMLNFLHQQLEYPVSEFFREVEPTLKLGVKFNWGKYGSYNTPFGSSDVHNSVYSGDFNNLSIISLLMEQNKTPFFRKSEEEIMMINKKNSFAYHIDNKKLVAYLKKKINGTTIKIIDDIVEGGEFDGENVSLVYTRETGSLNFDLIFDCSGFKALFSKFQKKKWISYGDALKTSSAITGTAKHKNGPNVYTTGTNLSAGWLWDTPLQDESHLGYVYSSDFISDDDAFKEMEDLNINMDNARVIRFKTGRYENSWVGNVISIGNAFAFIEPLESTGIHMILFQLRKFFQLRKKGLTNSELVQKYNEKVNYHWDYLKWFIALHFKFNKQLNTPFWKECNKLNLSEIQFYLDFYQKNGPVSGFPECSVHKKLSESSVFGPYSFDVNMAGNSGLPKEVLNKKPEDHDSWRKEYLFNKTITASCISHEGAFKFLKEGRADHIIPKWFE